MKSIIQLTDPSEHVSHITGDNWLESERTRSDREHEDELLFHLHVQKIHQDVLEAFCQQ